MNSAKRRYDSPQDRTYPSSAKRPGTLWVISLCISVLVIISPAAAAELEPLRLSLAPLSSAGDAFCGHAPGRSPEAEESKGRPQPVVESEHRPVPRRTYHFNEHRRQADIKAYVRRPDGSVIEPELRLGVNPSLSFPTPFGDGPVHGANNVYVVEQGIDGNVLVVRTAKWITMHHSCGWGHDGKFDRNLINPQPLAFIPFEIVVDDLWDTNFHARVVSGNRLRIRVLSFGRPVRDAKITVSTEKGWVKNTATDEDGVAFVQMIRDYYPGSWPEFHRTHSGQFLITARYDAPQKGNYKGIPHERLSYVATLPWKYSPSERDYSSYSDGLLIAILTMAISGAGVWVYRERRTRPYKEIVFDE